MSENMLRIIRQLKAFDKRCVQLLQEIERNGCRPEYVCRYHTLALEWEKISKSLGPTLLAQVEADIAEQAEPPH